MGSNAAALHECTGPEYERIEFYAEGRRQYKKIIPENERLIDWHKAQDVHYSAVSLHRLKNVRVWTDYQAICVYTEENQIIDSVSLVDDSFDFNCVSEIPIETLSGSTVLLPHLDPYNYYHWLIDTLAFPGVLELGGHTLDSIDNFYIHRMENNFQREHLHALGIEDSRVLFLDNGRKNHFVVEDLLIPMFRMDGGFWPAPWAMDYLKNTYLKDELAENLSSRESTEKRIYVARGNARRSIYNEAELMDRLSSEGYEIIEPHRMSLQEQAEAFSMADYVLGSHGAGLANIAFCKPDTKLLEFGGHYITGHFRIVATLNDLNYEAFAAGIDDRGQLLPTSYDGEVRDKNFTVDIERVVATANKYFTGSSDN